MIITASLQDIAKRCDQHFELEVQDCRSVFEFIKTELANDDFAPTVNFDAFIRGFRKTIEVTISKTAFIESELNAINSLLGPGLTAWYKQTPVNHYRAYNEIRSFILVGKDEFEVFTHYYMKYFSKEGSSYKLVSVIYCFGLIKYQLFLEGEPLKDEQQLKSIEGKQKREEQLTADVIGLFCHLVNKSNLVPQNDRETADQYCERVCEANRLPYTSSVRKSLYREDIDSAHLEKLQRLVFPKIDEKTKDAITKHLNRK